MFVFTSTNPCNCRSSHISSDPPCEDTCNCLRLCDIVIASNSDDAVLPCGGELILDLTDAQYEHDTCACGEDTQRWYVKSYDTDVFESVTLSVDGTMFNATTVSTAVDVFHSNVIIYFVCGNLSYYFKVVVGIQHPCSGVVCDTDQTCDPCIIDEDGLGTCVDNVDVGVG